VKTIIFVAALAGLAGCGRYVRASAGPSFMADKTGVEVAAEIGTNWIVLEQMTAPVGLRVQASAFEDETSLLFGMVFGDDMLPTKKQPYGGRLGGGVGLDFDDNVSGRLSLAGGVGGQRGDSHRMFGGELAWQGDWHTNGGQAGGSIARTQEMPPIEEARKNGYWRSRVTTSVFAQWNSFPDGRGGFPCFDICSGP
jgi:hypothetical protein